MQAELASITQVHDVNRLLHDVVARERACDAELVRGGEPVRAARGPCRSLCSPDCGGRHGRPIGSGLPEGGLGGGRGGGRRARLGRRAALHCSARRRRCRPPAAASSAPPRRPRPRQDKLLCKRSELERSILMLNATTSEVRVRSWAWARQLQREGGRRRGRWRRRAVAAPARAG
jgi:hypothetical protein